MKDSELAVVYLDEDENIELLLYMKKTYCSLICITALGLASALGQPAPAPPRAPQPPPNPPPPGAIAPAEPGLTRFDLDFRGGTPAQLVAAIEKAMGRPLNAIIPEDVANTALPALKMNNVDVSQLFQALTAASRKQVALVSPSGPPYGIRNYQYANISYGFRQTSDGRLSDDTIWYFYVEKPALPPGLEDIKVCRFYSLAPYLEGDRTVDDITTAIQTGWDMLGEKERPTISFHKDTKLLIAVGDPSKLEIIDAALKALQPQNTGGGGGGFTPTPRPVKRSPAPSPAPK